MIRFPAAQPRANLLRALAPAVLVTAAQPSGSPTDTTASQSVTPSTSKIVVACCNSSVVREDSQELTLPPTVCVLRSPIVLPAGNGVPSFRHNTMAAVSLASIGSRPPNRTHVELFHRTRLPPHFLMPSNVIGGFVLQYTCNSASALADVIALIFLAFSANRFFLLVGGLPFEGNYSSWLHQKVELLRILEKKETQRQKTLQRELEWIEKSHHGRLQKNEARVKAYEQLAGQQIDPSSETIIQIAPGPRLGEKVLQLSGVCKGYASDGSLLKLFENCTFNVPRGAMVGVIGPNGTGKTTLMRMVVGQEQPDAGTIELGSTVVLSYVDQHRDALDDEKTVFAEITGNADRIEMGNVSVNARAYVARFNFRGAQQQKKVGACSGGERNRIHLAKMLRRGGNLLLLDEPTNDLDVATMRVLEQAMLDFFGCALVISHDRLFLDRICTHLLVMEGDGRTRWFEGNFAAYEAAVMAENPDRFAHRRAKYHRLGSPLARRMPAK